MAELDTLGIANAAVFALLGVATAVHWRRRGGEAAAWLAASFGVLALVLVSSVVIPEEPRGIIAILQTAATALLFLFPYCLFRFTASFRAFSRPINFTAGALTVLVMAWFFLLPSRTEDPSEIEPPYVQAFLVAVLLQWLGLSLLSAVRLWSAGRAQPRPARRRMRLLGVAATGLSAALVLAVMGDPDGPAALQLALVSGVVFYLGFSPPRLLRLAWRGPEEDEFQRALGELMTARSQKEVAVQLLPHVTGIVGGRGSALLDVDGGVIGSHGDVPEEIAASAEADTQADVLRLRMRSGSLLVWTTPYSPFFAREEMELLSALGGLVDLAMERVAEGARAKQLANVVFSSHEAIISQDLSGTITSWNRGAREVFGYTEDEAVGRPMALLASPELVPEQKHLRERIRNGELVDNHETRRRRSDGETIEVSMSLSPIRDAEGKISGAAVIARDITERKEAARALQAAKEEAERANMAKSEFLSRMSHELRTPLNAILGFSQLLELEDLTEQQRQNVGEISKGGRHLLDLINEVLDIARIEVGKLAISLEPVEVEDVLDEVMGLIKPLTDQRGLSLSRDGDDCRDMHVLADKQRLKQVLLNLLSNAVKYNRESGSVRVTCEQAGDSVRISVTDSGPGIPQQRLAQLFVPFDRLGREDGTEEGTGLGLALAKRLMEAMGGTLEVESKAGVGSTFRAELAATESPVKRDDLAPTYAPSVSETARPARTVLYIEDNLSNLRLIEQLLARRPEITLLTAMQGRLGLDLAREHRPDLVLLDLQLPDVPGREILAALKAEESTREIPVIVVSADATKGQVRRVLDEGAHAYLTKPLDIRRLLELLELELGPDALQEREPVDQQTESDPVRTR